jgi:hypothetical protein
MPCKLGLAMYRAQRAARGLIRRGGETGDLEGEGREVPESRGRSAQSPGHLKRETGVRSARDFAPGRLNRPAHGPAPS